MSKAICHARSASTAALATVLGQRRGAGPTHAKAAGPTSPMPYGEGREVTCISTPDVRHPDLKGGNAS